VYQSTPPGFFSVLVVYSNFSLQLQQNVRERQCFYVFTHGMHHSTPSGFLCVGSLSQFRIATATERQGKRGKKKERELVVADNQDGIPDRNHF
jgi:hypothetical protein